MNPYSFLRPVTDPAMFYGYQPDLDYIVSKVASPNNPMSFAVMGGRMMGKTSLLRQAERQLKEFNTKPLSEREQQVVIPLYLDVLQLDDPTLGNFWGKVGYLLNRYFIRSPLPFDIPSSVISLLQSVQIQPNPLDSFADALVKLMQAAHPTKLRIALLIDDLWRRKPKTKELLTFSLRAFLSDPSFEHIIAYVITGHYHELEETFNIGSPLENMLVYRNLHVFDKEQSLALINEPTDSKIPPEVAHAVYDESGGHPFLLQFLMSELYEYTNWAQLTIENVYNATLRFYHVRKDFERWWEKLTLIDRTVYKVFCQRGQASPNDLLRMVLDITVGGRNILKKSMILDSLFILRTMGLIREREDGDQDAIYELAGQWYARWFLQLN